MINTSLCKLTSSDMYFCVSVKSLCLLGYKEVVLPSFFYRVHDLFTLLSWQQANTLVYISTCIVINYNIDTNLKVTYNSKTIELLLI